MISWATFVGASTGEITIGATDEVLLDSEPSVSTPDVTGIDLQGTLIVRDGFTLAGLTIQGPGLIRPEFIAGNPARRLTRLQFRNRFTQTEKVAIYEAATSSAAIRVWLDDLAVSTPEADGTSVDLDDPYCIAGVEAICAFLETAQVIADGAARAVEILA